MMRSENPPATVEVRAHPTRRAHHERVVVDAVATARAGPKRAKTGGKLMTNRYSSASAPRETVSWAGSNAMSRPSPVPDSMPDDDLLTETLGPARRRQAA